MTCQDKKLIFSGFETNILHSNNRTLIGKDTKEHTENGSLFHPAKQLPGESFM